jgi:hypothetical protein
MLSFINILADLPRSDQVTAALAEIAKSKRYGLDECARAIDTLVRKDRGIALGVLTEILDDPAHTIVKRAHAAEVIAQLGQREVAIRTLRTIINQCNPNDYWRSNAKDALRRVKRSKMAPTSTT